MKIYNANEIVYNTRRDNNETQKQMGEKLGFSQTVISLIESQDRPLTMQFMINFLKVYGVNLLEYPQLELKATDKSLPAKKRNSGVKR